jgi:hypothetical protein
MVGSSFHYLVHDDDVGFSFKSHSCETSFLRFSSFHFDDLALARTRGGRAVRASDCLLDDLDDDDDGGDEADDAVYDSRLRRRLARCRRLLLLLPSIPQVDTQSLCQ